jgi:hypothetical protein
MTTFEPSPDGRTLVVRIAMQFRIRGGRKQIVLPDGTDISAPPARTGEAVPDDTPVMALAQARLWARRVEAGEAREDIAREARVSVSYVHRILRLTLLAPDIVEAIVAGDWRPPLAVLEAPETGDAGWPRLEDLSPDELGPEAAGYLCRQTSLDRFPVGVSPLGPWLCYVPRRDRLYFVELEGTFEDYLGRRSAKSRHNLKRSVKKVVERNPGGALTVATTAEEMSAFHREAVAISRRTYQGQLLQAGLPDTPEFLHEMQARARLGEARGYLLWDQGKVIAYAWCAGKGTRMTYEVIGYLPEHAALSPGTVLLYLIVEDLFRLERFRMFDFGVGEASYKQAFATAHIDFSDAYLFRAAWRYRWRVEVHCRLDRFSSALGAWLEKAGLKKKVRMLIRRLRNVGPPRTGEMDAGQSQ